MRVLRTFFYAMALAAAGLSQAAAAPQLLPHRAVYDLTLNDANERSGITGLSGRMVYEFNGSACDGYTVNFRFVTQIETEEASRLSDLQTTTFEDGDGKSFNFVSKTFADRKLEKEVKGSASAASGQTEVKIQKPEAKSLDLAATHFPTQHLIDMIGRAEKSERFYETTIFDGSEDADRVMTTTVVIGKRAAPATGDPELPAMKDVAKDQVWPVEIAYFDTSEGKGEEVPSYRISFKLHANGVTRDLTMDYGDFSMKGRLVKFEPLPTKGAACGK